MLCHHPFYHRLLITSLVAIGLGLSSLPTMGHSQTPKTLLDDGFGGQPVNIHQPSYSKSDTALKGHLQQTTAWYNAGRVSPETHGPTYRPSDSPTRHAETMVRQYKLDAAEARFKQLLQQNPNNAGAHHGLALVTYYRTTSSNGEIRTQHNAMLADAVQHAMTALRLQPTYVDANITLARLYHELLSRTPDAQEYAANAYAMAPNSSGVLTLVGEMLIDDGDIQHAIELLEQATQRNSKNAHAYTQLGRAYAANRDYTKALQTLNTAQWLNPNSAPNHHFMATIYQAQGNQAAAAAFYKKALTIKPEYLPASLDLANLYRMRADWPQALETLKNAYHSILPGDQPEKESMALAIADTALQNRQPKVAQAYYQQALSHNPNSLAAKRGLSTAHVKEATQHLAEAQGYGGDLWTEANAQSALNQALQANRGNTSAKLIATKLYGHARNTQELGAQTQREIINQPVLTANDAVAEGEVWQARHDVTRATHAYTVAVRSADTPDDAIRVGDMLLTMGQPEQARHAFKRVLRGDFNGSKGEFNMAAAQQAAHKGLQQASAQREKSHHLVLAASETFHNKDPRFKTTLHKALAVDYTNALAHQLLAVHYDNAHQYDRAIRHYHVFSTLAPTHNKARHAQRRISTLSRKLATQASVQSNNPHTPRG